MPFMCSKYISKPPVAILSACWSYPFARLELSFYSVGAILQDARSTFSVHQPIVFAYSEGCNHPPISYFALSRCIVFKHHFLTKQDFRLFKSRSTTVCPYLHHRPSPLPCLLPDKNKKILLLHFGYLFLTRCYSRTSSNIRAEYNYQVQIYGARKKPLRILENKTCAIRIITWRFFVYSLANLKTKGYICNVNK